MSRLMMTPVPYQCRVCTTETALHVRVVETEDGLEAEGRRLWTGDCSTCEQERVHVIAIEEGDAAE